MQGALRQELARKGACHAMTRRVVITGMGTVNPLAQSVPAYWNDLLAGKSGIAPIQQFDTGAFKVKFAGEVKDFHPEKTLDSKMVRRLDRYAQFALLAAMEAVKQSGLDFARED